VDQFTFSCQFIEGLSRRILVGPLQSDNNGLSQNFLIHHIHEQPTYLVNVKHATEAIDKDHLGSSAVLKQVHNIENLLVVGQTAHVREVTGLAA